jgi:hypothetical protein
MDIRVQKLFAWCGPISFAMAITGAVIAGFVPPLGPDATAEQVANFYREHGDSVIVGGIVFMLSTAPFTVFISELSTQMRRMEGERRTFTYAQLSAGIASMVPVILVPVIWCATAFHAQHHAEIVQAFNDLGLITTVMVTPPAMAQVLVTGLAILADRNVTPVLPRWLGYFSLVVALFCLPGVLCVQFRSGPFAWNGVLAGALPSLVFFTWVIVTSLGLVRAVNQQAFEESYTTTRPGGTSSATRMHSLR